jgi:hypothetical protein
MHDAWKTSMARNYATVLDQIDRALSDCPDELWEQSLWEVKREHPNVWPVRRAGTQRAPKAEQERLLQVHSQFWNVAYHALFHVDFYLAGAARKGFAPPDPFREDDHHGHVVPRRTYTRDELRHYAAYDRERVRTTFDDLTEAAAGRTVARAGVPFGEFLLTTLLHTQEHAAQLSLFLGQHGVEPHGGSGFVARRQLLRNAVRGRTDAEIDRFAKQVGGYPQLLALVFTGFCSNLEPQAPARVAFDLGSSWVVQAFPGVPATFENTRDSDAEAHVRMSPQDFLRLRVADLDRNDAITNGRIKITGDPDALPRLLSMARP